MLVLPPIASALFNRSMQQRYDPRNKDLLININGRLVHRDQAGISPFDSAVQGGDAVWEGLRLYQGRIFKLRPHLDRLRDSAIALAFAEIPTHERITEQIRATLLANRMIDGVHVRLTLTRGLKITSGMDPRLNQSGPTLIVLAEFKPPVYGGAGIVKRRRVNLVLFGAVEVFNSPGVLIDFLVKLTAQEIGIAIGGHSPDGFVVIG